MRPSTARSVSGRLLPSSQQCVISGVGMLPVARIDAVIDPPPEIGGGGMRFRPFPEYSTDEEVQSRADQRAMSRSMLAAAWAAGKAIGSAGLKERPDILEKTELLTAGRCVEYDEKLDQQVISACVEANDPSLPNKLLREGSRPSLFLTQIPNLISANISIVHGVKGRSQTLFGDELGGLESVGIAIDRVATGETAVTLVGGVSSGESRLSQEMAAQVPPQEQIEMLGSAAGYCVLETATAAAQRGHRPLAQVGRYQIVALADDPRESARVLLHAMSEPAVDRFVAIISGGNKASYAIEQHLAECWRDVASGSDIMRLTDTFGSVFEASAVALLATGTLRLAPGNRIGARSATLINLGSADWASVMDLEAIDA